MRCARLVLAVTLLLLIRSAVAQTPGPVTPPATTPGLPTVRLGALLPLTGAGAWFGKEMRQGMEVAIAELNRPRSSGPSASGAAGKDAKVAPEPALPSPGVTLALEAADVQPLDVKHAREEFTRLAALGVLAVFTAAPGPALAIQPLAASRDVLVVHQGAPDGRLPAGSRTLIHTRPSVPARVDALLGQMAERGLRRIAIAAAGDEFGKAVRTATSARWRERGGTVVAEESLSLDVGDLAARLRQLARAAPEAMVLGFRGPDLGDLAARLREARYTGPLYLLDDDRAARLAAGSALEGAVIVSDAFVPEPGSPGERFADAYKKKYGQAPSRYAAQAYDAVAAIADGIRRARAEGRGTPGGRRLRETLGASPSLRSVYGGPLVLRDDGSLAAPLAVFTVDGADLAPVRHAAPAGRP